MQGTDTGKLVLAIWCREKKLSLLWAHLILLGTVNVSCAGLLHRCSMQSTMKGRRKKGPMRMGCDDVQSVLDPEEIALLMAADHRPGYCLRVLTEVIKSAELGEGQAIRMDENLSFFEEQVGACER